jgi:hypothetical protein
MQQQQLLQRQALLQQLAFQALTLPAQPTGKASCLPAMQQTQQLSLPGGSPRWALKVTA